jgi:hypothetical protein
VRNFSGKCHINLKKQKRGLIRSRAFQKIQLAKKLDLLQIEDEAFTTNLSNFLPYLLVKEAIFTMES